MRGNSASAAAVAEALSKTHTTMKITPGRIVLYVLSKQDCDTIEASRKRAAELLQIHPSQIGNPVTPGDIVPAKIVRVWSETSGCMNGQAALDGFDTLWLMSRNLDTASGDEPKTHGTWHWPQTAKPATAELVCERRDMPTTEQLAGKLYDAYCVMVGGKAFNGDALPTWADFSADGEKIKQANAWRAVAVTAYSHLV